jgi:hypothetical protein
VGATGDAAVFSLRKTCPFPRRCAGVQRVSRLPASRARQARTGTHAPGPVGQAAPPGRVPAPGPGPGAPQARPLVLPPLPHRTSPRPARRFAREQLELGISPLVQRIAQAHELARVVERRRRNFFHLLGALRGVAPPLVNELPPGVCPLFYPLWVPDREEALAGSGQRTWRRRRGGAASTRAAMAPSSPMPPAPPARAGASLPPGPGADARGARGLGGPAGSEPRPDASLPRRRGLTDRRPPPGRPAEAYPPRVRVRRRLEDADSRGPERRSELSGSGHLR